MSDRGARDGCPSTRTRVQLGLIGLPVAVVAIGGWSHRWVSDDAYIDFRVVGNVLAGHGPVYNVGERIEVITNPIWVGILTLVRGTLGSLPTAWWAVLLGLTATALGVGLSGVGSARLARRRGASVVIPAGMLCLVCVDAMWDFATSGLETGLTFGWIGLLWWLLVRRLETGRGATVLALLAGLGPFIRPDLGLVSVAFAGGLVVLMTTSPSSKDRRLLAAGAFLVPPVLLELLRAAYFGMLLPNTALTKSAFTPWPSQGLRYLLDTLGPTWIWILLLILGGAAVRRGVRWGAGGHRLDLALLLVPVVAAMADGVYVVVIGGDFMHARMLLPCLFLLAGVLWLDPHDRIEGSLTVGVALFCMIGITVIRYPVRTVAANGISNERGYYIAVSGSTHPISQADYFQTLTAISGRHLARLASRVPPRSSSVLVTSIPGAVRSWAVVPGRSVVPARLIAPVVTIGVNGVTAGSAVYLFDLLSLANPIGSHLERSSPSGRPGHNDPTSQSWMMARFVPASSLGPVGSVERRLDTGERRQLACPTMAGYLHAITTPVTPGLVWGNLRHSLTWTTLRIPAAPGPRTPCPR
ncbi:MAG: hypothetical protein WCG96_11035 [Actinomycetes bacterium]